MSRDYPAALGEFEKAASLNPSLPALQAFYGKALMAVGSREEAARAFRAELRSDPHSYEANLYLGVLEAEERRHQEALRHFRKALAVRPESIEARYQLATLHLTMEDSIEALAILEPIVAEAPAFVEAHISLATVYHRLGRREDARRHRSVVAELNAKKQAQAPGAGDELGPAYRGELPKPPAPSQEPPQRDPSQGDRK